MADETPSPLSDPRWWDAVVDHHLAGVFEGGGAKGVAYVGALAAVLKRRCWFSAVAGASAGAITSALIAAGLNLKEIWSESQESLKLLSKDLGPVRGLFRLWSDGHVLKEQGLRSWLDTILWRQVEKLGKKPDRCGKCEGRGDKDCTLCLGTCHAPVTFSKLWEASQIELHVVAASVSSHQIVVFNHILSPHCQVTEAVLASSAIPFVFGPRPLREELGNPAGNYHMVVDGGVASNFPMFVFTDDTFRERSSEAKHEKVLGFLLDEEGSPEEDDISSAQFVHPAVEEKPRGVPIVRPKMQSQNRHERGLFGWLAIAVGLLLTEPLAWMSRIGTLAGKGRLPQRWPKPANRVARNVLDILDGSSATLAPFFIALLLILVLLGGWYSTFTDYLLPSLFNTDFLGLLMGLVLCIASILLVTLISSFVLFNVLLSDTIRRVGPGLFLTYLTGSGAPSWARRSSQVVAIPVPKGIGPLSFDLTNSEIRNLWSRARERTNERLDHFTFGGCLSLEDACRLVGEEVEGLFQAEKMSGGQKARGTDPER